MIAKRILVLTTVAALGFFAAGRLVQAATPPAAPAPVQREGLGPFHPLERIHETLRELNLTDDQKVKIKEVAEPYRQSVEAWRDAHKTEIEKIRADIKAAREAKDRAQMRAALAELRPLLETFPRPKETIEKIETLLTPEQLTIFKARIAALRERLEEFRERHPGAATQPAPAP